jgi:hypothetical protein
LPIGAVAAPDLLHTSHADVSSFEPEENVTTDPVQFVSKFMPELFNAGIAEMRAAADKGDAAAQARHADLLATQGAMRVVLEGKVSADLYLLVQGGVMRVSNEAKGLDVLVALALPFEALEIALEELEGDITSAVPKLKKRIARLRAATAMAAFGRLKAEPLLFHLIIKDTPDFEQILIKVAIGSGTPPLKPTFTVILDYETFQEVREGKVKPQAMMGKLQISGDFSRAMAFGMELMQKR